MLKSWGNRPIEAPKEIIPLNWRDQSNLFSTTLSILPYGLGRSYGDSCLNSNGRIITTHTCNRLISFDPATGRLACEAGTSLVDIMQLTVPKGWTLPVVPGTQFVTVGGAIANDVHGKNHHMAGTFGCHVKRFMLLRSTNQCLDCSATENEDYFRATIGGLGLTGLILSAEIQLVKLSSPFLMVDYVPFKGVDEFLALSASAETSHEFTAAWIDCYSGDGDTLRGILMQANYCADTAPQHKKIKLKKSVSVPFAFPQCAFNKWSIKAFNQLYYHTNANKGSARQVYFKHFFFPLDTLLNWNRIYGKTGFYQYQCVVDKKGGAIKSILNEIFKSGQGSFLSVLKVFGDIKSPGLLSFPRQGITLALDFPNHGDRTLRLFERLDAILLAEGGRLYPAKDARMSAAVFQAGYSQAELKEFTRLIDPKFSSNFWRRVNISNSGV